MSRLRFLALCLASATLVSATADALTENPIDPALPPDVHTRALCPGQLDFTTGTERAACAGVALDENPTTLSSVTGNGEFMSDLRTGTLRSRSTGRAYRFGDDNLRAPAFGQGQLYDTITVLGFSGTVELRMAVEGRMLVSPTALMDNRVQAWLLHVTDDGLMPNTASVRIEQAGATPQPPPAPQLANEQVVGQGSVSTNADAFGFFDPSDMSFVLSLFVPVSPSNPSFTFVAHLDTVANAFAAVLGDELVESDVDFGNTAQLALIVPEGVQWTSSSGAFLVPEPDALALTAIGFATLATRRRRVARGRRAAARLAPALALGLLAAPAFALTTNPIDPDLPLDQQAWTLCTGASDASTGSVQAHCQGANPVENPETLSSVVGTTNADADLRSGALLSRSTAQAFWSGDDQIRAGAFSQAVLYDTITIESGFTGTVELRMAVAGGFFTTDANPNVMQSDMNAQILALDGAGFFVANAGVQVLQFNSGEVGLWTEGTNGPATITTNVSGPQDLFDPADVQVVLSLFVPVTPGSPTFSLKAQLSTSAALGYTAPVNQVKEATTDFGNTAQLAVIVPEGVTWHSASGAFLVSEPSAPALLATALLALGASSMRR